MSDGGEIGKRAGGRKGRERGGGKKLRGTGEDEPPRYKECAALKKGRREKGRKGGGGKPKKRMYAHNFLFFILLFIYFSLSVILLSIPADSRRNPSPRPASPFSVTGAFSPGAPTSSHSGWSSGLAWTSFNSTFSPQSFAFSALNCRPYIKWSY